MTRAPTAVSTASLTPPGARCWTITIPLPCCGSRRTATPGTRARCGSSTTASTRHVAWTPQPFSYRQTPAQRAAQYARAVAALGGLFARSPSMSGSPSRRRSSTRASTGPPRLTRPGSPPRLPTRRGTCRCWCCPAISTHSPPRPRAADRQGHGPVRPLDPGPQRHARQRHGRPGRLRLGTGADVHQGPGRPPADERVLRGADAGGPGGRRLPATLARVTAAIARPGDQAGRTGCGWRRRPAAVGDAVALVLRRRRAGLGPARRHLPVHRGQPDRIRLTRVRWTSDTPASGTVWWNQVTGRVWARLTIVGPGAASASVRLWYFDYVWHSAATCPAATGASGSPPRWPPRDRSPARRPEDAHAAGGYPVARAGHSRFRLAAAVRSARRLPARFAPCRSRDRNSRLPRRSAGPHQVHRLTRRAGHAPHPRPSTTFPGPLPPAGESATTSRPRAGAGPSQSSPGGRACGIRLLAGPMQPGAS